MRLCYNSLFGTIARFYKTDFAQSDINKMLIWSVDETFERVDDSNKVQYSSELYSGRIDIKKDLQEKAESIGPSAIISNVSKQCATLLSKANIEDLKMALCQLIAQSSNIDGDDIVLPSKGTKKIDILKDSSSFEEFLGNIIYFIFVNALTKNSKKTSLDSRNEKNIFDDDNYKSILSLAEKYKNQPVDITNLLTIEKKADFDKVFSEISNPNILHSKTPNQFKLYCLDVDADGFNYNQLKEFITNNLNTYIFSRTELQGFIKKGKVKLIGIEALKEIKKKGGINGDELGNILLYSYLECVLKAPKIFSHFEATKNGIENTGTLHIAYLDGDIPMNQVVIGSADIEDSLISAVDKALKTASDLKTHIENSFNFVDSSLFNKSLEQGDAQKIKDIVIPNKTRRTYASTGFGIFVGYRVNVNPLDYDTPEDLAKALQDKLIDDINDSFGEIEKLIGNYGLFNRSVYLYVLPFNDPTNDKNSIIEEVTSV